MSKNQSEADFARILSEKLDESNDDTLLDSEVEVKNIADGQGKNYYQGVSSSSEETISVKPSVPSNTLSPKESDMGMLQSIRYYLAKGNLTREHLIKCTELAFNTAFKHMALQCSVGLAKANQEVLNRYLKDTVILRRELHGSLRRELLAIADEQMEMVMAVANERHKWKNNFNNLKNTGKISEVELMVYKKKADEAMHSIIKKCDDISALMVTTIEDQMAAALLIKVEELIGSNFMPKINSK